VNIISSYHLLFPVLTDAFEAIEVPNSGSGPQSASAARAAAGRVSRAELACVHQADQANGHSGRISLRAAMRLADDHVAIAPVELRTGRVDEFAEARDVKPAAADAVGNRATRAAYVHAVIRSRQWAVVLL
jgi:hypothetical protein